MAKLKAIKSMKIHKIPFESYTSLDDEKALDVLQRQNSISKNDHVAGGKQLDLSDDAPWLKLHMEQQTVILKQWTAERKKLLQENRKLKLKLEKSEEMVSKLKDRCGMKKKSRVRSRKQEKTEKTEKTSTRKAKCEKKREAKTSSPHVHWDTSSKPSQYGESLSVCSNATTVVIDNVDYSRLNLAPAPHINPKKTTTTITLHRKSQDDIDKINAALSIAKSRKDSTSIKPQNPRIVKSNAKKVVEKKKLQGNNSVETVGSPVTPPRVGIHRNSAFKPFGDITTPPTDSENSDSSPLSTSRNSLTKIPVIRKSSLQEDGFPLRMPILEC